MKRVILMLATVALFAACNQDTDDNTAVQESELVGTWDGASEGFAAGHGKRYRITFTGNEFTRWECSYEYGKLEEGGTDVSFRVCMKESGTWTYANGTLTLSPNKKWNSYIIHCDQYAKPLWYECGTLNEATLESDAWWEINGGLWDSTWVLTKDGKTIHVEIKFTNMDRFNLEKQ